MSMATDSVRAAVRDLLACDLLALYSSLRRSTEFVVLATAAALEPSMGDRWLAGRQLKQADLRQVIDLHIAGAGQRIGRIYSMLSDYAHGRVEALALYGNRWAWFEWPVRPDGYDYRQVRAGLEAVASLSLHHWEAYRVMTRDWSLADTGLREFALDQEKIFHAYVRDHTDSYLTFRQRVIADGLVKDWLERSLNRGKSAKA